MLSIPLLPKLQDSVQGNVLIKRVLCVAASVSCILIVLCIALSSESMDGTLAVDHPDSFAFQFIYQAVNELATDNRLPYSLTKIIVAALVFLGILLHFLSSPHGKRDTKTMTLDDLECFGPRMLSWTSHNLSSHKLSVILIASVLVLISGVDLANWNLPKAQSNADMKSFFFVLITLCVFVAAFWIVSASSFERSIKEPLIAIINAGNSKGKNELTDLLCHYCLMVDLPLTPSDFACWAIGRKPSAVDNCDKVFVTCRIVYVCLWSCLSLYLWMLLATYSCPQFSKNLLITSII